MTFLSHLIFHHVLITHVPSRHHRDTRQIRQNPIEKIFRRLTANIIHIYVYIFV